MEATQLLDKPRNSEDRREQPHETFVVSKPTPAQARLFNLGKHVSMHLTRTRLARYVQAQINGSNKLIVTKRVLRRSNNDVKNKINEHV